jgi:hypothetical protein
MGYKRQDLAVRVDIQTAKGYTMKEISALEQRIKNLEYYTVLNALALDTKTLSIRDANNNIERFKNGIFADPFNDDTIARSNDVEFNMAISSSKSIARPNYTETFNDFEVDTTTSSNYKINTRLAMLNYEHILLGGNPYATTYRNCAETFFSFRGSVSIFPSYDGTNVNTQAAPQVMKVDMASAFQDAAANGAFKDIDTTYSAPKITKEEGRTNYWAMDAKQTITDIKVSAQSSTQDLGNFIKDVSMLPYMRGRKLGIIGRNLKPNTILYPFFDKKSVSAYCAPGKIDSSFLTVSGAVDTDKFKTYTGDPSDVFTNNGALNSTLKTDSKGNIIVIFYLPENTFRAGERIFTLANVSDLADTGGILTSGEGVYTSQGLSTTSQNLKFEVIEPQFTPSTTTKDIDPLTWTTVDPPPPPSPNQPSPERCCFDPEAKVTMADGTLKKICEIIPGDKVRTNNDNLLYNNVIGIESPAIGNRLMYSFNDNWAFVSEEHPIMTDQGWGAFNPDSWAVEDEFKGKLVKIDIGTRVLKLEGGYETVETINTQEKPEDYIIYNLMLDGDNTFVVEGYIVHNKSGDGWQPPSNPGCSAPSNYSPPKDCSGLLG